MSKIRVRLHADPRDRELCDCGFVARGINHASIFIAGFGLGVWAVYWWL